MYKPSHERNSVSIALLPLISTNKRTQFQASAATTGLIRIPGWANKATVNGAAAKNGTLVPVPCGVGTTTIKVELNPEVRVEFGWGMHSKLAESAVEYTKVGAPVPTADVSTAFRFDGCGTEGPKAGHGTDIRSGGPGQLATGPL